MLEQFFVRPTTVDRIRASWLGPPIEQYVGWLAEHGYSASNVGSRVPILLQFGEFSRVRGAAQVSDLPAHVDAVVEFWIARRDDRRHSEVARPEFRKEIRGPVEQFLRVMVPGFKGRGRSRGLSVPFAEAVPGFFRYLREERGLRGPTLDQYGHHLRHLEGYLRRIELRDLSGLSPVVLSSFITETSRGIGTTGPPSRLFCPPEVSLLTLLSS